MWRKLLELFRPKSPAAMRAQQLEDAMRELVQTQHSADSYIGHVKTLQARIARLQKEIKADKPK